MRQLTLFLGGIHSLNSQSRVVSAEVVTSRKWHVVPSLEDTLPDGKKDTMADRPRG